MKKFLLVLAYSTFLFMFFSFSTSGSPQADRWNDLAQRAAQLAAQGRFADALPVAKDALTVAENTFGKAHLNYGLSENALGYVEMSMGNLDDAEGHILAAKATIEAGMGSQNVNLLYPLTNLAQLYYARATASQSNSVLMAQYLTKAESYARISLSVGEKNFGVDDVKLLASIEALGSVCVAEKKFSDAGETLQRSLKIERENLPSDHAQIIRTENEIGWVFEQMGNRAGALQIYQSALASAKKTLGDHDPTTTMIQESLDRLSGGGSTNKSGGGSTTNNAGQGSDAGELERCYAVAQASCMSDCIYNYHNSEKTCRQKLCSRDTNLAYWNRVCTRDLARGKHY